MKSLSAYVEMESESVYNRLLRPQGEVKVLGHWRKFSTLLTGTRKCLVDRVWRVLETARQKEVDDGGAGWKSVGHIRW
jgi:hypothetical protein